MPSKASPSGIGIPPAVFSPATSIFLWGPDRRLLNQLVFHFSRQADPEFVWLEIKDPVGAPARGEPSASELLRRDHLLIAAQPPELRPETPVADPNAWSIVNAREPTHEIAKLKDFLTLPRAVQELVGRTMVGSTPKILAVANSDRIATFYPETRVVGSLVRLIEGLEISLFVSYCGGPRPDRFVFQRVFRVEPAPTPAEPFGTLFCEQSPPLPEGGFPSAVPISEIPGFDRTIAELELNPQR
jgi:hypothetical protein